MLAVVEVAVLSPASPFPVDGGDWEVARISRSSGEGQRRRVVVFGEGGSGGVSILCECD